MVWLFDYDLTLYGRDEAEVLTRLDRNITRFLNVRLGLGPAEADETRRRYWREYGTTLAGLRAQHGVSPADYFDFIHDGGDLLYPRRNPDLRALLLSLPGRRWIFTNARRDWVGPGLRSMGIEDCFDGILDIETFAWRSKPSADIYPMVEARVGDTGDGLVLFDDRPENLLPARARGWRTVLVGPTPEMPTHGCDVVVPRLCDFRATAYPAWFAASA